MEDEEYEEEQQEIEKHRKAMANKIALRSEQLVEWLFDLAANAEDDKVRLSAINTLLDRGIPKLGVEHAKQEAADEPTAKRELREEIEQLFMEEDDDE